MVKPTIYDVAKHAGVGIGTVSRVLNNSEQVSADTRQRVMDAIHELKFKPNHAARKLPSKTRQRNIGVLTQPFQSYPSFVERLRGVQSALNEQIDDFELIIYSVNSLEQMNDQITEITQSGLLDALIVIDFTTTEDQRRRLSTVSIPFVNINHNINANWPCIATDNVAGGRIAAEYLLSLGHRKIAYIGDTFENPYDFPTSKERFSGLLDRLAEDDVNIPDHYIHLGPHGFEAAKLLTRELLDQVDDLPTAIFAMSDMQALGCVTMLRESGLRVPEDISVLGYDNLDISQHVGISTLDQHLELSGRRAVEFLTNQQAGDALPAALPDPIVIPRQTTQSINV